MDLFGLFHPKSNNRYWDTYKKTLIEQYQIPFNELISIDKLTDEVIARTKRTQKTSYAIPPNEPTILHLLGIAYKSLSAGYDNVIIVAENQEMRKEIEACDEQLGFDDEKINIYPTANALTNETNAPADKKKIVITDTRIDEGCAAPQIVIEQTTTK